MPRFYCPQWQTKMILPATDDRYHYWVRVRRLGVGDAFVLFDGLGYAAKASLTAINAKFLHCEVGESFAENTDSPIFSEVVLAVLAQDKMDFAVQKLTELGVRTITPLFTARTQSFAPNARASRLAHWHKVAVSACEQCGRNQLPTIASMIDLEGLLGANINKPSTTQAPLIFWAEQGGASWPTLITQHATAIKAQGACVLIGPEGGWDEDELAALGQTAWPQINLGPRILRAETSAIKSLSVLQALLGDG